MDYINTIAIQKISFIHGIVHCTYIGAPVYNYQIHIVLFCLKTIFTFTNSVDPDKTPH